jgi:HSP20 family molecular chaperone IbpA
MRYRRLHYRYAMLVGASSTWLSGDVWSTDRLRLLATPRWRPDADMYETTRAVEVIVDLAGVEEEDFEVQLFEDALVVEGFRRLPSCAEGAIYQAAAIRQGPFRLEVVLPAPVDSERVEARYDGGLLRITLAKREGAR